MLPSKHKRQRFMVGAGRDGGVSARSGDGHSEPTNLFVLFHDETGGRESGGAERKIDEAQAATYLATGRAGGCEALCGCDERRTYEKLAGSRGRSRRPTTGQPNQKRAFRCAQVECVCPRLRRRIMIRSPGHRIAWDTLTNSLSQRRDKCISKERKD